ncbi:hypothetical protein ACLB2K_009214 [Fragaria x ananassa]
MAVNSPTSRCAAQLSHSLAPRSPLSFLNRNFLRPDPPTPRLVSRRFPIPPAGRPGPARSSDRVLHLLRHRFSHIVSLSQAVVGNITPSDNVPKKEKSGMEAAALNEMCIVLGGGMRAEEIKELWEEYENNSSVEANLVKDFDKVEMILQALEYEMGMCFILSFL